MASSSPITLVSELLDYCADGLTAAGCRVPSRRYVSHGRPAGDWCEELVAWIDPIRAGGTQPDIRHVTFTEVRYHVALTYAQPVGTAQNPNVNPAKLTGAAVELGQAGWALWRTAVRARREVFGACERTVLHDLVADGPQGGFGSWVVTLDAAFLG